MFLKEERAEPIDMNWWPFTLGRGETLDWLRGGWVRETRRLRLLR